jgi:hypothetical protein
MFGITNVALYDEFLCNRNLDLIMQDGALGMSTVVAAVFGVVLAFFGAMSNVHCVVVYATFPIQSSVPSSMPY